MSQPIRPILGAFLLMAVLASPLTALPSPFALPAWSASPAPMVQDAEDEQKTAKVAEDSEPTPLELFTEGVAGMDEDELLEQIETLSLEVQTAHDAHEETVAALKEAPDDAEAVAAEEAAALVLSEAADKLEVVCTAAAELEIDTSEPLALLISVRGIDVSTLDTGALAALAQGWVEDGKAWAIENLPGIAVRGIAFLLVVFVFWILAGFFGRLTTKAMSSSRLKMSDLLRKFFGGLAHKIVFFVGLLFAFSTIGVDLAPVLAGVGIIGFVVGFALQETLGNFAAGIMILMYRPFDVGNLIETGGKLGRVVDLTLVSTTLTTLDNKKVIVPNGKIWGDTITNVTAQTTRRVDLVVGISYSDDIRKALQAIQQVMEKNDKVISSPAPEVGVLELGESSVDLRVRPWCKTDDYWDVASEILIQVKMRLDEEGISIPFPQRDVHMIAGEPVS